MPWRFSFSWGSLLLVFLLILSTCAEASARPVQNRPNSRGVSHYRDRAVPPPQVGMEVPEEFPANCDVWWGDRYWAGSVLKKEGSRYFITYPGWARKWDEWVGAERLRCPGSLKPSGPELE